MTPQEFLMSLELRMNAEFEKLARNPRFPQVGDGIIIQALPFENNTLEGVWWTLGGKPNNYLLRLRLTPKAVLAWKRGDFEKLIPHIDETSWFDFDELNSAVTIDFADIRNPFDLSGICIPSPEKIDAEICDFRGGRFRGSRGDLAEGVSLEHFQVRWKQLTTRKMR